ncbi:sulfotransferase family protein, partial [bacterium]|nr:sulfotransferase family protein [bacterium]
EIWDQYFKFTFIRNPWDKMVSSYHFNHHKWVPAGTTFEQYIQAWDSGQQITRFPPQHSDYLDEEVNFIGRFENLDEDYNFILKKLGLPPKELVHLNKSRHKHYKDYYNENTKEIVKRKFSKDIETWGFEY